MTLRSGHHFRRRRHHRHFSFVTDVMSIVPKLQFLVSKSVLFIAVVPAVLAETEALVFFCLFIFL